VFDSRTLKLKPGEMIYQDRLRTIDLAVAFKRITCHKCNLAAVYKYRVQQLRRKPEISLSEEVPEVSADLIETWKSIPRFAEIPETVKCKGCGEVLGLSTSCIF
jgi:hypothetical protein